MSTRTTSGKPCRFSLALFYVCELWWPNGWDGGWKRGLRVRGYIYTYSWFILLDSRNEHNIVNLQIYCKETIHKFFKKNNKASATATTKTTYTIGLMWGFHESVCERYWKQCLAHRQVCSMCISSCEVLEPITVRTYWIKSLLQLCKEQRLRGIHSLSPNHTSSNSPEGMYCVVAYLWFEEHDAHCWKRRWKHVN